jgi:hypothetical protein
LLVQAGTIHSLPGGCADVAGPVGVTGFVGRRPVVTGEAKVKYIQDKRVMINTKLTSKLNSTKNIFTGKLYLF